MHETPHIFMILFPCIRAHLSWIPSAQHFTGCHQGISWVALLAKGLNWGRIYFWVIFSLLAEFISLQINSFHFANCGSQVLGPTIVPWYMGFSNLVAYFIKPSWRVSSLLKWTFHITFHQMTSHHHCHILLVKSKSQVPPNSKRKLHKDADHQKARDN